ncbi:MAG: phosphopentomutase/phosphoglucosamine mutase [Haloarculaceae archaeon]
MTLFGTAGIRGDVAETMTPALALSVGRAVGEDAADVALGHDGRTSSPALADAVAAGLQSAGASVERLGEVPTPALAFAARGREGVMITASHNPPADNGLKLFSDGEEYDRDAESRVDERVAADAPPADWDAWGEARRVDRLPAYRAAVTEYASDHGAASESLSVAVDCGNGVGGLATPQVLRTMGADVTALEANVDGHFPARESKPTASSLTALAEFVAGSDADLGIAHDGDADRVVFLDAEGHIVHEDTVIAVLAEHFVRQSGATDPVVVTTPNASARIDERVSDAGGRVERVRLGALHEGIAAVRAAGEKGTETVFAAEPWKHIHPANGPWIDGIASAAVFTRLVADSGLDALRAPVTERPSRKVSVACPDERKDAVMDAVGDRLPAAHPDADVSTEYGVRLEFPDASWVLVRPSGTEPYVRVYAESDDVDELVDDVVETVQDCVAEA